jgi:ABC-2 type transport system permease protein
MNARVRAIREMMASLGFAERNFMLVKRYAGWEAVFLTYTVVSALTIGLIGVATGDKRLVLFLIVGAVLWGYLSILFHEVSECIAWERWEGTLEYTFMAPVKRLTQLFGNALYAITYGLGRAAVELVACALFFGISLRGANFLTAAVVLVASSLPFLGMGLGAAVLPLLSRERGSQATHIFQALVLLVSGVYYDIKVLPTWLQPFSHVSPATYTLRAMRSAILDGATLGDVYKDIIILVVSGVVLIPLGFLCFALGERWAKKTGKLKIEG